MVELVDRMSSTNSISVQHIRHATFVIHAEGKRILVDPMLSEQGDFPPIPLTKHRVRNPMVPLPVQLNELLDVDAIILTHGHIDHLDEKAKQLLGKDLPVFCQPEDEKMLQKAGFQHVIPVKEKTAWSGIEILRTNGEHGTGIAGKLMGKVSGFMLTFASGTTIYIAGDTVYTRDVEQTLKQFQPDVAILNTGAAQLLFGGPITMTAEDVRKAADQSPYTKIIAVHMDAINHCMLTRQDLLHYAEGHPSLKHLIVPMDGEIIQLPKGSVTGN